MWRKYVTDVEKKIGKLTYVSWRNKQTGWHDSYTINMEGGGIKNTQIGIMVNL